jgi:hypothetical protein
MTEIDSRTVTKKVAACRQITAAIKHYEQREYECAITLAGAAEGQLTTNADDEFLFNELRRRVPPEFKDESEWVNWLNAGYLWLKHSTPQLGDEWVIDDRSAEIMILRAISKFNWAYREATKRMINFETRWHNRPPDSE